MATKRGVVPDCLRTNSAHDPDRRYVPNGMTLGAALEAEQEQYRREYKKRSMAAMAAHVKANLDRRSLGGDVDYGKTRFELRVSKGREETRELPA